MTPARKWLALLCAAFVLFAAIAWSPAAGLPFAILNTLYFVFAILVISPIRSTAQQYQPRPSPFPAVLSPRAPPLA